VSLRGRNLLHCCSWDFLNLNLEPHFKRAAQRQIEESGIGVASSRGSAGTSRQLLCCENKLAQFLGCESALLFSSTNQAIFTLLTSLLSDRDLVVYEELLQSPVGDAAYLMGADIGTFCGSKLDELGSFLENKRAARHCYIVAEAVKNSKPRSAMSYCANGQICRWGWRRMEPCSEGRSF